jgi:hypothetical protein
MQADLDARRLWWAGPLTVVAANLAVIAVREVAFALLDLSPQYPPLTYVGLALFTTVLVSAGVLVFVVVVRMSPTPINIYRRVALAALALSMVPDLFLPGQGPGATWTAAIVLMVLHVAAWLPVRFVLTNPAIVGRKGTPTAMGSPSGS